MLRYKISYARFYLAQEGASGSDGSRRNHGSDGMQSRRESVGSDSPHSHRSMVAVITAKIAARVLRYATTGTGSSYSRKCYLI